MSKYRYHVTALNDEEGTETEFVIESPRQLDRRVLQLVGLILDDGMEESMCSAARTAECHVGVDSEHEEQWVTDMLNKEQ